MIAKNRWWTALLLAFFLEIAGCTDNGPSGPPTFDGLSAEVEILRDDLGIVHVFGAEDADVFYGSGYMQAVDRLFEMELTRRRALGRQAEVLGEDFLEDDRSMRLFDFARWGRENEARMREEHPGDAMLLEAWVAGVNRRVDEVVAGDAALPYGFGPEELDFEPEPWTVADALAVGKMIIFGNDNQLTFDLLATLIASNVPHVYEVAPLFQPMSDAVIMPPGERPSGGAGEWRRAPEHRVPRLNVPEEEAARRLRGLLRRLHPFRRGGSNNWAVDGRHTDTGRPMMSNDPHQPLASPSLMWAQHLNSADRGGAFDVAGFSFVGTPGIQLGHTAAVVWGATTASPDVSDLWDVAMEGDVVRVGDRDVEVVRRTETIEVRGGDTDTYVVEEVPGHGVLIPEDFSPFPLTGSGRRALFDWVGFRPTNEMHVFLEFDRAGGVDDIDRAVGLSEIGSFNWVAADVNGILYRSHGLVPDRGEPSAMAPPWLMLDGDDPGAFWSGEMLPDERLPHSRGEARGWLASANNDPFGFTLDGSLTNDPWYYGAFFNPGARSQRVEEEISRLVERGDVTLDDLRTLQLDTYFRAADELAPLLEAAWAAVATDDALEAYRGRSDLESLAALITTEWDRRMDRGSPGALAFYAWLNFMARRALGDDLAFFFGPILEAKPIYLLRIAVLIVTGGMPDAAGLLQAGRDVVLVQALDDTAGFLTDHFGGVEPERYRWGDFHGSRFANVWGGALDGGWTPTDGSDDTINQASAPFFLDGAVVDRLDSDNGVIFRQVTTFDADGVPRMEVGFPRGNSGEPDSPHWDDRLDDWVEGRNRPLPFTREEVEAAAVERLILAP